MSQNYGTIASNLMKNKSSIIFLVTFMCVLPILSSDIYFPVLPEIAAYFHTTPLSVKNSLSLFLFGFAIGQLFYGVLSDLFGRKKLLMLGLIIYFFSTLACAIAPTIDFKLRQIFSRFCGMFRCYYGQSNHCRLFWCKGKRLHLYYHWPLHRIVPSHRARHRCSHINLLALAVCLCILSLRWPNFARVNSTSITRIK